MIHREVILRVLKQEGYYVDYNDPVRKEKYIAMTCSDPVSC